VSTLPHSIVNKSITELKFKKRKHSLPLNGRSVKGLRGHVLKPTQCLALTTSANSSVLLKDHLYLASLGFFANKMRKVSHIIF
jgi:hypothetical protein